MIRVRDIRKSFGSIAAVDGVTFEVHRGEIFGLLGPNGAGKSTLMKILAGVLTPDSGEVFLSGQSVRFAGVRDAVRAGIALVHQELNLADNLDIAGNIALGREPNRFGFLDRKAMHTQAREWIERVGLDLSPASDVSTLSIGRRQMVEIAKALSLRAKVLILDEPTSSLDVSVQAQVLNLMQDLAQQYGVTYLLISHDLAVVNHLCDEVAVLYQGRVVEQGSPQTLFRAAAHPYTQALLAAVPRLEPSARRQRSPTPPARQPSAQACPYAARCPQAQAVCDISRPELRPLGKHHTVACHLDLS